MSSSSPVSGAAASARGAAAAAASVPVNQLIAHFKTAVNKEGETTPGSTLRTAFTALTKEITETDNLVELRDLNNRVNDLQTIAFPDAKTVPPIFKNLMTPLQITIQEKISVLEEVERRNAKETEFQARARADQEAADARMAADLASETNGGWANAAINLGPQMESAQEIRRYNESALRNLIEKLEAEVPKSADLGTLRLFLTKVDSTPAWQPFPQLRIQLKEIIQTKITVLVSEQNEASPSAASAAQSHPVAPAGAAAAARAAAEAVPPPAVPVAPSPVVAAAPAPAASAAARPPQTGAAAAAGAAAGRRAGTIKPKGIWESITSWFSSGFRRITNAFSAFFNIFRRSK